MKDDAQIDAAADRVIAADTTTRYAQELRLRALQLAIGACSPGTRGPDIVTTAVAFHAFLSGTTRH